MGRIAGRLDDSPCERERPLGRLRFEGPHGHGELRDIVDLDPLVAELLRDRRQVAGAVEDPEHPREERIVELDLEAPQGRPQEREFLLGELEDLRCRHVLVARGQEREQVDEKAIVDRLAPLVLVLEIDLDPIRDVERPRTFPGTGLVVVEPSGREAHRREPHFVRDQERRVRDLLHGLDVGLAHFVEHLNVGQGVHAGASAVDLLGVTEPSRRHVGHLEIAADLEDVLRFPLDVERGDRHILAAPLEPAELAPLVVKQLDVLARKDRVNDVVLLVRVLRGRVLDLLRGLLSPGLDDLPDRVGLEAIDRVDDALGVLVQADPADAERDEIERPPGPLRDEDVSRAAPPEIGIDLVDPHPEVRGVQSVAHPLRGIAEPGLDGRHPGQGLVLRRELEPGRPRARHVAIEAVSEDPEGLRGRPVEDPGAPLCAEGPLGRDRGLDRDRVLRDLLDMGLVGPPIGVELLESPDDILAAVLHGRLSVIPPKVSSSPRRRPPGRPGRS